MQYDYKIKGPDGFIYTVRGPEGASDQELFAAVEQQIAAKQKQGGFWESLFEGATTLGAAPAAKRYALDDTQAARERLIQESSPDYGTTSWADADTLGQKWDWAKQNLGQTLGYFATPAAAGAAARAAVGATPLGRVAGLAALASTMGGQYMTTNLARQATEQEAQDIKGEPVTPVNVGRAALAAAGQTGLDLFALKPLMPLINRTPFVRALFGGAGKEAEQAAELAVQSYARAMATGAATSMAYEIPTEISQQILERWQAGLPLNDLDARREYGEAFVGAALMGGVFGGVSGAVQTGAARSQVAAEEAARNAEERRKEDEAQAAQDAAAARAKAAQDAAAAQAQQAAAAATAIPGTEAKPSVPVSSVPFTPAPGTPAPTVRTSAAKPVKEAKTPPAAPTPEEIEVLYSKAKEFVLGNKTNSAISIQKALGVPLSMAKVLRQRMVDEKFLVNNRVPKPKEETPAPPAAVIRDPNAPPAPEAAHTPSVTPTPAAAVPEGTQAAADAAVTPPAASVTPTPTEVVQVAPPKVTEEDEAEASEADNFYPMAVQYLQQRPPESMKTARAALKAQFKLSSEDTEAILSRMINEKLLSASGKFIGTPDATESAVAGADRTSPAASVPANAPAAETTAASVAGGLAPTGRPAESVDGGAQASNTALTPPSTASVKKPSSGKKKTAPAVEQPAEAVKQTAKPAEPAAKKVPRKKVVEVPNGYKVYAEPDGTFSYETKAGDKAIGFETSEEATDAASKRAAGAVTPAVEIEKKEKKKAEKKAKEAEKEAKQAEDQLPRTEQEVEDQLEADAIEKADEQLEDLPTVAEAADIEAEVDAKYETDEETAKKTRKRKTPEERAAEQTEADRRRAYREEKRAERSKDPATEVKLYRVIPSADATEYKTVADLMAMGEDFKNELAQAGLWFTTSYDQARLWQREYFPDGSITGVVVPRVFADALRVSAMPRRSTLVAPEEQKTAFNDLQEAMRAAKKSLVGLRRRTGWRKQSKLYGERWRGVSRASRPIVRALIKGERGEMVPRIPTTKEEEVWAPPHVKQLREGKRKDYEKTKRINEIQQLLKSNRYLFKKNVLPKDDFQRVAELLFMARVGEDNKALKQAQTIIYDAIKYNGWLFNEDTDTEFDDEAIQAESPKAAFDALETLINDEAAATPEENDTRRPLNFNRYSRRLEGEIGISLADLTKAVEKAFGIHGRRLMESGKLKLVQSVADLPGKHPDDVKGLYDGKTAYLVADNIGNPQDVKQIMLHEVGVHAGLKNLIGEDAYNQIAQQIKDQANAGNPVFEAAVRVALATNPDATEDVLVEEAVAYLVETAPEISFVRRLFSMLKAAIRKWIGMPVGELTQDDIVVLATAALKKHAKSIEGKPKENSLGRAIHASTQGIANFWRWFGDSKMVDEQGRPLVLYHGTSAEEDFTTFKIREGISFSTYLGIHLAPDPEMARTFAVQNGGRIIPLYVKAERILDLTGKSIKTKTGSVGYTRGNYNWIGDDTYVAQEIAMRAMTPKFLAELMFMKKPSKGVNVDLAEQMLAEWNKGNKVPFNHEIGLQPEMYSKEEFITRFMLKDRILMSAEYNQAAKDMIEKFVNESGYDAIKYTNTNYAETETAKDNSAYIVFKQEQVKSALANVGAFNITEQNYRYSRRFDEDSQRIWNNFNRGANAATATPRLDQFVGAISTLPDTIRNAVFGMLSMPQIAEVMGKDIPSISKLLVTLQKRASSLQERKNEINHRVARFNKLAEKYRSVMPEFFNVAHQTTVDQFEVYKDFAKGDYTLDPNQMNKPLMKRFMALPKELQDAYLELRKEYKKHGDTMIRIIEEMSPGRADKSLRNEFERKRLKVYLPLLRMGNYWLSYKDASGEEVTMAFDSPYERNKGKEFAKRNGGKAFREFSRLNQMTYKGAPGSGFVGEVLKILDEQDVPDTVRNEIYQTFMNYLPSDAVRQQYRQREGIAGFMPDAFQVYANMGTRIANQLSNMEYALPIEQNLEEINSDVYALDDVTPTHVAAVENIRKQVDFLRNPVATSLVNKASYFSYLWYIAGNVSSALVNLTQLPIIVYPLLGGKYGYNRATEALSKATKMYVRGGKDDNSEWLPDWTFGAAANLDPKYKRLYQAAVERTAIRRSTGYEIVEAQRMDSANYSGLRSKVDHIMGFVFQNSERANREITLLAAFDLALQSGKTEKQAIEEALAVVNDAHGVALAEIGPRFFQQGLGKVMFTFKRFAQAQIYLLYRLFKQATKGEDAITQQMARRQLLGIYAMAFAFAGTQGLPLYGGALLLAKFLEGIFGDDDEFFDPEARLREAMGDVGYKGPINKLLGVDIASRTGFNGLLWRDDPKRLADLGYFHYAVETAMGPAAGALINMERGAKLFGDGEYERGLEAVMPAAVRSILKSTRLATEGALTTNGVPIVDDISAYNSFMQVFGFNPAELAEARANAGTIEKTKSFLTERRGALLDKFDAARMAGDREEMIELIKEMDKFNRKNPDYAIDKGTLERSYKQRRAREARTINGVYVPDKLRRRFGEQGVVG